MSVTYVAEVDVENLPLTAPAARYMETIEIALRAVARSALFRSGMWSEKENTSYSVGGLFRFERSLRMPESAEAEKLGRDIVKTIRHALGADGDIYVNILNSDRGRSAHSDSKRTLRRSRRSR